MKLELKQEALKKLFIAKEPLRLSQGEVTFTGDEFDQIKEMLARNEAVPAIWISHDEFMCGDEDCGTIFPFESHDYNGSFARAPKHCPGCGRKLDWSDVEDQYHRIYKR